MKRYIRLLASMVLLLSLIAPAFAAQEISYAALQEELNTLNGKPVLLTLFATYDEMCQKQITECMELYNEYHDRGMEIIAIALNTATVDEIDDFIAENNIPFPVYLAQPDIIEQYNVTVYPWTLLIDKNGTVVEKYRTLKRKDYLEQQIQPLL